jgi:hypothetical protein
MIMPRTKGNLKKFWPLANNGRPDRQRLCSPLADFFHNNAYANDRWRQVAQNERKTMRYLPA